MKRNYLLDLYKAVATLMVMLIHVLNHPINAESQIAPIIYTYCSLAVPVFFVISGYFMEKSHNLKKGTIKLIKSYLIYSAILIIVLISIYGIQYWSLFLKKTLFISYNSMGFLWFIKFLIFYRIIYTAYFKLFGKDRIISFYVISIVLALIPVIYFNGNLQTSGFLKTTLFFTTIGHLFSRYEAKLTSRKISKWALLLVPFYFTIFIEPGYHKEIIVLAIPTFIILLVGINSNINSNGLEFYSRNSIRFLFMQYLVSLILASYITTNIAVSYLVFLAATSVIVLLWEQIERKITNF